MRPRPNQDTLEGAAEVMGKECSSSNDVFLEPAKLAITLWLPLTLPTFLAAYVSVYLNFLVLLSVTKEFTRQTSMHSCSVTRSRTRTCSAETVAASVSI
jgi:hypothetical protein